MLKKTGLIMKLKLQFTENDFNDFRSFEKAVKKQVGNNVFVDVGYLCLYFEYPKALQSMLRPYPSQVQLEFELESSKPDSKN